MSIVEERLTGIENRIEMLLERQYLSRFDNMMFLAYPLVILGINVSLSFSLQFETIRNVSVWSLPLTLVLDSIRLMIPFGLGMIFLAFIYAYATDDIPLRISCLRLLVLVVVVLSLAFLALFLEPQRTLTALFPTFQTEVPLVLPIFLALGFLSTEVSDRFAGRVVSWFEKHMPIILKTAQVSTDMLRKTYDPLSRSQRHSIVKVLWSGSSVMYILIFSIAAWRGVLNGITIYPALYGLAFFLLTEAVFFGSYEF